jgi:glycosyltransferase involved in cell wall biosynthesis
MTIVLLFSADRVWGALADYEQQLRPYALGRHLSFGWLPVPSNVPVVHDSAAVAQIRKHFAPAGFLLGHFGTFGRNITDLLQEIIPAVLENGSSLLLMGSKSDLFRERLLANRPDLAGRIHATGFLDDAALSSHLSACDVLIQPYPDGVTARRGSMLAPLAHGCPVVTNPSPRTEKLWKETQAVVLAPATGSDFRRAVLRLQADALERSRVSTAARETYLLYFKPDRMVQAIQNAEASCAS